MEDWSNRILRGDVKDGKMLDECNELKCDNVKKLKKNTRSSLPGSYLIVFAFLVKMIT